MATLINYSHEIGLETPLFGLTVCLGPGLNEPRFVYMGAHTNLHEIWRTDTGSFHYRLLTEESGAPKAWQPHTFVDLNTNKKFVVFLDGAGSLHANKDVHAIYWSPGAIGTKNLTREATNASGETPGKAKGKPVAFYSPYYNSYRVIHLSAHPLVLGGDVLSLWWPSLEDPVQYEGNLTASASAPRNAVNFTAYASAAYQNVIYTSSDGEIRRLFWATHAATNENLSAVAGTPPALIPEGAPDRFSPSAYYTAHNDMHQIVYLANDGHLWELFWQGEIAVLGWDLMAGLEAPQPESQFVTYYNTATNTKHVIYPHESQLHEIWWMPGGSEPPAHNNLSQVFGLPPYRPFLPHNASLVAFAVAGSNNQHVAYISADEQIYELIW